MFRFLFHSLFSFFPSFSLNMFISLVDRSLIFRRVVRCAAMLVAQLKPNSLPVFFGRWLCRDCPPVDCSLCLVFGLTDPARYWIFCIASNLKKSGYSVSSAILKNNTRREIIMFRFELVYIVQFFS